MLWRIAKLTLRTRRMDGVSVIVPESIRHERQLCCIRRAVTPWRNLVKDLANLMRECEVGAFVSTAECIATTWRATFNRLHYAAHMVLNVDPVTNVCSVAVDR